MRIDTGYVVRSSKGDTKVVASDKQIHVSEKDGGPMTPTGQQVRMTTNAMKGIDVYA